MQILHFSLLVITLTGMFIVGIVVGRVWEQISVEEKKIQEDQKDNNYFN